MGNERLTSQQQHRHDMPQVEAVAAPPDPGEPRVARAAGAPGRRAGVAGVDEHHRRERRDRHLEVAVERVVRGRREQRDAVMTPRAMTDGRGGVAAGSRGGCRRSGTESQGGADEQLGEARGGPEVEPESLSGSATAYSGTAATRLAIASRVRTGHAPSPPARRGARAGRSTTRSPATKSAPNGCRAAAGSCRSGRPPRWLSPASARARPASDLGRAQRRVGRHGVQDDRDQHQSEQRRIEAYDAALNEHPPGGADAADGLERHSIVVMMKPLSTKKMSTPMEPPWKSGSTTTASAGSGQPRSPLPGCRPGSRICRCRSDGGAQRDPPLAKTQRSTKSGLGRSNPGLLRISTWRDKSGSMIENGQKTAN